MLRSCDNDAIRSTTQGAATTTYDLDAPDRRSIETTTVTGSPATQTTRYYTTTPITRPGPSATAPCRDTQNSSGPTWRSNYGWLGASQRATSPSGLMLVGARVYNPASGTFGSVDPVRGGNANAYTYPADPVNRYDITGKREYRERSVRLASHKQIKKLKRLLRKAKSRARSAMRTYKRAKARGRSGGGWDCFWAITELLILFGTFVALAFYGQAWIFIVFAIGAFVKGIHDVNSNCTGVFSDGRD
jgi:RHS repeat-associated protein